MKRREVERREKINMEKERFPEKQTWGTWEELLLACAVHRYGTESWDSVSMEMQKRSSKLHCHLLSPHNCKRKYLDLQRRFNQNQDQQQYTSIPWLDELRKLRVAELRTEVQRYDHSIVSLQLKLKKLTEEREQCLKDDDKATQNSDLEKTVDDCGEDENNKSNDAEPVDAGKEIPGEDSDRDNRSSHESNSTDPKDKIPETGGDENEKNSELDKPIDGGSDPVGESARRIVDDSYNGSLGSAVEKGNSERLAGDSGELWESVSESKGEEEGTKESSSDVQSSESKKGDEPCNEDQSPSTKTSSVQSQPLLHFLNIIRSHCSVSIFEHWLQTQETPNYTSLIRQHVDLKTIQTRLEEGWYSGGDDGKFFRDLLLLFNNAIVFFGQKSSESMAAIKLRQIVLKEMASKTMLIKPEPAREEQKSTPPVAQCIKSDPEPSDSLLLKTKISVPLTACRKRSSITAKALASSSSEPDKKREQIATLKDEKEKLVVDCNQHDKSSDKTEENRVTKKRTRERSKTNSRNSNKNGNKGRTNPNTNKNSDSNSNSRGVSHNENSESRLEKEKKNSTLNTSGKKKSAANFLNRMKRSSSSHTGSSLLDTLKSSDNGKRGAEQKKNCIGNGKGDLRKEQASSRKVSGGKQAKMQVSPNKRSVGRPPKRAAAPSPALPAKRGREAGETEASASRHSKKRSRK